MLTDIEKNTVTLSENPNPHLLILGVSGSGKTYYLIRKTEEALLKGKKVLIFDYSASYTQEELRKDYFQYLKATRIYRPTNELKWIYRGRDMQSALLDAFVKCLKVGSYYQKKLLKEAINIVEVENEEFSVPLLMKNLEELKMKKEDIESQKNIVHLLTRLSTFSEGHSIKILKGQGKEEVDYPDVAIMQFSDMGEIQRKFWTEFFAELLWDEVRQGKRRADVILFDEFQNMSMQKGSALTAMLREGRRFGIAAFLSSQFIGNYTQDEVDTLMQAGNLLFFRPTVKDLKYIASIVDEEHMMDWKKRLGNLQKGEFVLKGRYILNQRKKELETPIICRVESLTGEKSKVLSAMALKFVENSKLRGTIY